MNNRDGTWKEKYRSMNYEDNVYDYASMAIDKNSHAHFAFYNWSLGGPAYLTNAPNGTWSDAVSIHNNWIGGQMEGMMIDIAVDNNNIPHISYVGSNIGAAAENHWYATKKTGTWTSSKVDNGSWSSRGHTVGTDSEGIPHIAYLLMPTGEIRHATNYSGSWSHETIDIAGTEWGQIVDLAVDKQGNVHLVYDLWVYDGQYDYQKYVMYATNKIKLPAPEIVLSPSYLEFGTVDTGAISKKFIYIKNVGTLDLHVSELRLSGRNAAEFTILHSCDVIEPEDSCEVEVSFAPEVIGRKQATLEVASDDPDMPVITADITGRTPYPVIKPVPGEITFSTVEVGEYEVRMLTLKNTGDANLEIDSLKITGDGADAYLWISICQEIPPFTDCNLDVYFAPTSPGTHSAELHIYSNDPENPEVTVTLKGRPPSGRLEIVLSDDESANNILDFGTVPLGKIANKKLILKNTGERDLVLYSRSISGNNASLFHASNACASIPQGDSCIIEIVVYMDSLGSKSAQLNLLSNDPDNTEVVILLKGFGIKSLSKMFDYYGDDNECWAFFYCMDKMSTGDLLIGGSQKNNALLTAITTDGEITWQKKFHSAFGFSDIHAARELWDNGFIVAGDAVTNDPKDLVSFGRSWIARLDMHGNIIWQKEASNFNFKFNNSAIFDIKVTSSLDFIAAGTVSKWGYSPKMWIGKFNSAGEVLWQKYSETNEFPFGGYAIVEDDNGNYIVAFGSGRADFEKGSALCKHPDGGYLYGGWKAILIKFSPDGDIIWQKAINPESDVNKTFWLLHFDDNGNILWQYAYKPVDVKNSACIYDLTITGSGDIIAVGDLRNHHIQADYQYDIQVLKLTKSGEIIWQKQIRAISHQKAYKVLELSSGSIVICGHNSLTGTNKGWLVFLSPEGLLEGCVSDYIENSNTFRVNGNHSFETIEIPFITESNNFLVAQASEIPVNLLKQNWCTGIPADMDYDGIPNEEEYGPSGLDTSYDGNNDGLPDALQSNVASFHTFNGSGYVTLEAPPGTQLNEVSAEDNPSPDDQPEDIAFPLGFFKFSVTGLEAGDTVALNLYFPAELTPVTYYKHAKTAGNPEPHWYEFLHDGQTGAVIQPGKITLHFKDGARGDEDLTENGIIEDIGGPGTNIVTGLEKMNDPSYPSLQAVIYPNPSTGNINIRFNISQPENVRIIIYDIWGRKVRTLISEAMVPGNKNVEFGAEDFPGGIYFIRIEAGKYQETMKLILQR